VCIGIILRAGSMKYKRNCGKKEKAIFNLKYEKNSAQGTYLFIMMTHPWDFF
jgi:hypothetical protein